MPAMQQERPRNVIANGSDGWEEVMALLVLIFFVLLILTIVRELLPRRKQKRRRRLGSDIRRVDPESVDTPVNE